MSKFTRRELHKLQDFISACNGDVCCSLDAWSTGSGRYRRVKTLPPFVHKVSKNTMHKCINHIMCINALRWLRNNPRNVYVLCLDLIKLSDFLEKNCLGKEM